MPVMNWRHMAVAYVEMLQANNNLLGKSIINLCICDQHMQNMSRLHMKVKLHIVSGWYLDLTLVATHGGYRYSDDLNSRTDNCVWPVLWASQN